MHASMLVVICTTDWLAPPRAVNSVHISTYKKVTQTLLTWQTSLVKLCGILVQISDSLCATSSKMASIQLPEMPRILMVS